MNHRHVGLYTELIVLAVPALPAMPRMRALDPPAFGQRREAWRTRRTRLDCDGPARSRRSHPGVQGMIVLRLIGNDRLETRNVVGQDVGQQARGCFPLIDTGTGHEDSEQLPQHIDQHRALAPLEVLAAIIPSGGTSPLGDLDRLTVDACSAGEGCPAARQVLLRKVLTN